MQCFAVTNPSPSFKMLCQRGRPPFRTSHPTLSSAGFDFPRPHRVFIAVPAVCRHGLLPLRFRGFRNRSVVSFAASHEESAAEIDVDEKSGEVGAEEPEEEWKQTLASFKEQALKMQSVSQEAYEQYTKKAVVILKETSEKLKIQAEKARNDLSVTAKEISEEGKVYLSTAAENSPEPVRDIVETFASSTEDVKEISEVHDFYLGIPYGILLSVGGFLLFMLTGSISAIRFGVILGGAQLAFSVLSLKSWKQGESTSLPLKGQTAVSSILFLKATRSLFQRASFITFFTTLFSGAIVVFYLYRIYLNCGQTSSPSTEQGGA